MRSEPNNMDDLFRKKEEESQADLSQLNSHWKNMRTKLPHSKPSHSLRKYFVPVAASLLLIGSLVAITKFNSDGNSGSVTQNTTIIPGNTDLKDSGGKTGVTVQQPLTNADDQTRLRVPAVEETMKKLPTSSSHVTINIQKEEVNENDVLAAISVSAEDDLKAIQKFMAALKPLVQSFTIDNAKDTLIICKEGTSLFIPAGSFETISGNQVAASVHVEITEHYNFADMVANNLTTTSGEERLVTAGMIHIQATSAKQELKVKNGKSLDLNMPGKVDPRMQLFSGEVKKAVPDDQASGGNGLNAGIDWIARGQQQVYYNPSKKNIRLLNLGNYPLIRYKEKRKFFTNQVVSSRSIATFDLPFDSRYSRQEMKKLLEEKYSKYYDEIRVRKDRKPLSKKRQLMEASVDYEWGSSYVGDSVMMPIKWAVRQKHITVEDSMRYEDQWRAELEEMIRRNKSYTDYLNATAAYNFKITSLGWINCDRFLNYPRSRTTEFVINTGFASDPLNSSAMIVFKGENSIMPGYIVNGKVKTGRVPLGDPVTFVAITVKKGIVYTCVQDMVITKAEVNDLEFKPSTPEEFKRQLSSLGSVIK